MMKLKRIITFIKGQEKIRNQNIEDQIENHNTINVNWMIKLKTTKTFTKGSKKKKWNSKNEDHIREYNIW
jgi:hypothetical protein